MNGQMIPIGLTLIASLLGAFAQFFFKEGASKLFEVFIFKNYYLILGLVSFVAVLILILAAFRMGGRMLVVYSFYSTTYIWGVLIAHYLSKEQIGPIQFFGALLMIAGIFFVSK